MSVFTNFIFYSFRLKCSCMGNSYHLTTLSYAPFISFAIERKKVFAVNHHKIIYKQH